MNFSAVELFKKKYLGTKVKKRNAICEFGEKRIIKGVRLYKSFIVREMISHGRPATFTLLRHGVNSLLMSFCGIQLQSSRRNLCSSWRVCRDGI